MPRTPGRWTPPGGVDAGHRRCALQDRVRGIGCTQWPASRPQCAPGCCGRCACWWSSRAEALSTAEPVSAGRLQVLERTDGVTIINDAFNANSQSMRTGLETLISLAGDRRTVAILGEMKELGDTVKAAHAEVGRLVGDLGIDVLVTVGTSDEMTALAESARPSSPLRIESADDPDILRPLLNRLLTSGDVVLVKASKSVGLEKFANILHAEVPA
ncbi:glutamate ligase domain-containing protein [Streptomyces sp. NPDC087845]|uniref:glutamate ligase domain-containing protein n=1 Tax=Streptomyces sp. NPDC087845 TaxID=3365806 RepID=UPI00381D5214